MIYKHFYKQRYTIYKYIITSNSLRFKKSANDKNRFVISCYTAGEMPMSPTRIRIIQPTRKSHHLYLMPLKKRRKKAKIWTNCMAVILSNLGG